MIRLLHLADLHLDAKPSYLADKAEERGKDFLNAFERAVNFALDLENDIHAIVIAGDLFDSSSPSTECVRFTVNQLKGLKKANIPIVMVPGNHDSLSMPGSVFADPPSQLRKLVNFATSPNIERFCTLTINGEEVHFYGMAWDPGRSTPPFDQFKAEADDSFHIAVIHGTLEGAHFYDLHSRDVPLSLDNLTNSGMDYIALGHIHSPQMKKAGKIPVVYPGTLEGKRFSASETGERTLCVVTLEKGKQAKFEKPIWNKRTIQIEKLNTEKAALESQGELVEYLRKEYASNECIIKITLEGSVPFLIDVDNVLSQLDGEFFYLDIIDHTNIFDSTLIEEWEAENTIRGLFVRKIHHLMDVAPDDREKETIELALKFGVQSFQKDEGGK